MLATYGRDFYAGMPALTMNQFGAGRAIYFGSVSHQFFYNDLISWARGLCDIAPQLRVPDTVELSIRQKDGKKFYFILNHQAISVRLQFFKPMHDHLTATNLSGPYDLPAHGVIVLTEINE